MSTSTKINPNDSITQIITKKARKFENRNLTTRIAVGTLRGTGALLYRGGGALGRTVAHKFQDRSRGRMFVEGYEPEPGEIPRQGQWRMGKILCLYCACRFNGFEAMAQHLDRVHGGDRPEIRVPPQPTLAFAKTRKLMGRVVVQPVRGLPSGRHRKSTQARAKVEVSKIINDYQKTMNIIGGAMDDITALIKRGYQGLADCSPVGGPNGGLSNLRELCERMERTQAFGAEATLEVKGKLIRLGLEPMYVQHLTRAAEALEESGRAWTATINIIEEALAPDILAARKRREGAALSDQILAN